MLVEGKGLWRRAGAHSFSLGHSTICGPLAWTGITDHVRMKKWQTDAHDTVCASYVACTCLQINRNVTQANAQLSLSPTPSKTLPPRSPGLNRILKLYPFLISICKRNLIISLPNESGSSLFVLKQWLFNQKEIYELYCTVDFAAEIADKHSMIQHVLFLFCKWFWSTF